MPTGRPRSDFQLIAGTNRDLRDDVDRGRFREDLLARINLWTFGLPALRERREDIEPNIDYELERYGRPTPSTCASMPKRARLIQLRHISRCRMGRKLSRAVCIRKSDGDTLRRWPHQRSSRQ